MHELGAASAAGNFLASGIEHTYLTTAASYIANSTQHSSHQQVLSCTISKELVLRGR